MDVALTTVTALAAAPPMDTPAPATKPVPVIVTPSPPPVAPSAGETPETVGAGETVVGGCGDGAAGLDPPPPPPHDTDRIARTA